jgi:hypothetical protein
MSEKRYYVNAKSPFRDGTAYVERTGSTKVCVLNDGYRCNPSGWDRDHQMFADTGSWREITEDEAKSLVKVADTLSESKGETDGK